MDLTEAMFTRRSVRAYEPRPVEESTIRALLKAAVQAPSAMNRQPWLFSVVQNRAQLKRYSDRAKALLVANALRDPKVQRYEALLRSVPFNIFYDAGTLVVVGASEHGSYAEADCWLAAQNLMLAARAAGLGSCCIGFAVPVLNTPEVKEELGFPSQGAAVAPIILGYPSTSPAPVARGEPKIPSWSHEGDAQPGRTTMTQGGTELKQDIEKSLEALRTLRDEVRVRLHLASMDVKDEWEKLEPRLLEVEQVAESFTEATSAAVTEAVTRLKRLRSRLS